MSSGGNFFNRPSTKHWTNILGLVELLFSLPVSNGHLERVFSQLKSDRRKSLHLTAFLELPPQAPIYTLGILFIDIERPLLVKLVVVGTIKAWLVNLSAGRV